MKAKIIIVYDEKEQMYSANSPELERYHILSTEGYDIPDVLEHYVANIEREICMCERMLVEGDVSDMDDEDFHADEVLKALTAYFSESPPPVSVKIPHFGFADDPELTTVVRFRQLHIYRNGKKLLVLKGKAGPQMFKEGRYNMRVIGQ